MKKSIQILITVIVIIMSSSVLKAQENRSTSGVYLNENDYKAGKISYSQGKIRLNAFLSGKNIVVTAGGKKIKLAKNEIFGYRLNNEDFRLSNHTAYRILDTAGFVLYSAPKLEQQGKGKVSVDHYFYSINTKEAISGLTIANLTGSFPEKPEFRYRLQAYFKSDADLMIYDKTLKEYEIKYLYFQQTALAAHYNR
jgi:hypothetical protein